MVEPIILDGITFLAINKWKNGRKQHINFTSTTPDASTKPLCAYKSQSEVGTWRLFVMYDRRGTYYKGAPSYVEKFGVTVYGVDYVQQSFIHYDLQKYFNSVLDVLPEITGRYPIIAEVEKYIPGIGNDRVIQSIKDEIDDPSRMEKIEPFFSYFNKPESRCGFPLDTRENLLKLSEEVEAAFPVVGIPELVYENYTFIDNDLEMARYGPDIFTNKIMLTADIYKTKLGEVGDKQIILYFMIYSINTSVEGNNSIKPMKEEYKLAPCFLTTSNDITPFGLYSKYVLAGNYICKVLDYTIQCYRKNKRCTRTYSFTGDMYDSIYPFTTPTLQSIVADKKFKQHNKWLAKAGLKRVKLGGRRRCTLKNHHRLRRPVILGTRRSKRN
jgi:hypothetical protein